MDTPATPQGQPERPAEERRRPDPEGRRAIVRLVIGLFVLVVFIIFVIQNSRPVPVDFVFFNTSIRLIWVFLGCALIGAVVAWLVGRPRRRAMQKLIEQFERQREGKGPKR
ncbi:MAG: LapA family protein [Actinomycetota bacterium]